MAGVFSRLFKIGQAEAHSVVDKFEDPIKLTEQGIRDLKKDLHGSMTSLAEVKGIAIRMSKDAANSKKLAAEYERKAMLLLQKAQNGQMDMAEAERLATEAIMKKEDHAKKAIESQQRYEQQQKMVDQLQGNINKLKSTVSTYENDLITLRARAKTASSIKKINQQMARVDSSSTIAMLEKMKDKVARDEELAEAYGEMADANKSLDDELDSVIGSSDSGSSDALAEMKRKLNME